MEPCQQTRKNTAADRPPDAIIGPKLAGTKKLAGTPPGTKERKYDSSPTLKRMPPVAFERTSTCAATTAIQSERHFIIAIDRAPRKVDRAEVAD